MFLWLISGVFRSVLKLGITCKWIIYEISGSTWIVCGFQVVGKWWLQKRLGLNNDVGPGHCLNINNVSSSFLSQRDSRQQRFMSDFSAASEFCLTLLAGWRTRREHPLARGKRPQNHHLNEKTCWGLRYIRVAYNWEFRPPPRRTLLESGSALQEWNFATKTPLV